MYSQLYSLLSTPSASHLHECVPGLGHEGTLGPPITLPWPWVLGLCLMEPGGKKHREDSWLPADKLLPPQPLTHHPQHLLPGVICSFFVKLQRLGMVQPLASRFIMFHLLPGRLQATFGFKELGGRIARGKRDRAEGRWGPVGSVPRSASCLLLWDFSSTCNYSVFLLP